MGKGNVLVAELLGNSCPIRGHDCSPSDVIRRPSLDRETVTASCSGVTIGILGEPPAGGWALAMTPGGTSSGGSGSRLLVPDGPTAVSTGLPPFPPILLVVSFLGMRGPKKYKAFRPSSSMSHNWTELRYIQYVRQKELLHYIIYIVDYIRRSK